MCRTSIIDAATLVDTLKNGGLEGEAISIAVVNVSVVLSKVITTDVMA